MPQAQARGRRWIYLAGFIVFAVAVYLVGNGSVALWDRDEPRYAQTSRQMLQSGDWIVPKLLDEPREKKPVFIYWCQAASMKLLSEDAFAARLPSAVFVTFTLVAVAAVLWKTVGLTRALWTTFIFASSGLTIAAAKMCITDGVLIFFVTVAQLCLYQAWRGKLSWTSAIIGGLSVGFGVLTKGPVVVGVMLMTLLALFAIRMFDRSGNAQGIVSTDSARATTAIQLTLGIVLAIAVVVPWLYAIEQRLPGYTLRTLREEVLTRAARPQEGHKGPPGYYLLTIWGTFLPWSVFLPGAILGAWKHRGTPQIRFALAAVVGPWIMFELVATKLVHYLLPVFPPLAFLTADFLIRTLVMGIGMMLLVAVMYGLVLPHIQSLRIAPRVADVLIRQGATRPGDAIMIDYKETSLAFYQGGTIRPQRDNQYLQHTSPDQWPRWIVLTADVWKQTPPSIQQRFDVIDTVHGWNYADGGRVVDVMVLRKRS
jgi:4-amino-4-deoxy-L-arabinose transferase-like glycosyltransferase